MWKGDSYLGSVTLVLMIIALAKRRTYPRAGFWWLALATLIVLSLGAYLRLGGRSFSMPALWMWRNVPLCERQDLISLLLGDSRFDGDVILRQARRSFQSSFVLLHLLGGDSNAIGILAMEAFHDRVPALPGHS